MPDSTTTDLNQSSTTSRQLIVRGLVKLNTDSKRANEEVTIPVMVSAGYDSWLK